MSVTSSSTGAASGSAGKRQAKQTAVSAPLKLSTLPMASTGAWLPNALTKASAKLAVKASDQPSLD